jgi:hypothetical protein
VPGVGALAIAPSDNTAEDLWDDGGKMSGPSNPQELNRYSYVNNNPLRYTDPTGHWLQIVGGAAWGGGGEYAAQVWHNYRSGQGWNSFRNINWCSVGREAAWGAAGALIPIPGAGKAMRWVGRKAGGWANRAIGSRASAWASRAVRGGACALNSFDADTPVTTPNGPKPISTVKVGDTVLAYHEALDETGTYTVTDIISHQDQVTVDLTIAGERVDTTPEHAFFTEEKGWVPAQDLEVGMHVLRLDGTSGVVQSVLLVQQPERMYNLSVAEAHTFFVGDGAWLVHNCANFGGEHARLLRKYGKGAYRELPDGRRRYYGKLSPSRDPGEMAGRRYVREWNLKTGRMRDWNETIDHTGRIRIVRPVRPGPKIHYMFDRGGRYIGPF